MAPYESNENGFWGNVTATIDWCESNYDISYYFAEFCKFFHVIYSIFCELILCMSDNIS